MKLSNQKIEVNRPCCLCGHDQSVLVFEKTYPAHGYPGFFVIRQCQGCGLWFNSPRLPDDQFPRLYGDNYYFFYRNDRKEFFRILNIYRRTVALIQDIRPPATILEIGSAKGYLLALLKALGWQAQGVDISTEAARYAEAQFGVPTFPGTIEQYAATQPQPVQVVLAIDVLEHVLDPRRFLAGIDAVIQDHGLLIIDTPNGGAHNITVEGIEWKGFNPFHIFLFSAANITRLLQMHGYRIETIFSYGNALRTKPDNFIHKSLEQARRSLLLILQAFHIANETRLFYQRAVQRLQFPSDPQHALQSALKILEQNPGSYYTTVDHTDTLAAPCQGDNLVVIARKGG